MFKKLEINIPFANALAQISNYVKFMKEIMSNKRKLEAYETVIELKNGELTLRVGDDQDRFNLYKSMDFPSDEKASCMRIDTWIPSQDEMLYDFGKISSLEQCLTKSISTAELDNEDLSSTSKLIETVLALEMTEENYVLQEEKKTLDGLVLK